MAHANFRVADEIKQSLRAMATEHNVPMTQLAEEALRQWLLHHRDDIPEHLKAATQQQQIVAENKHRMKRMWFRKNIRRRANDALSESKSVRPTPKEFSRLYLRSCIREAREVYESDELVSHARKEYLRYSLCYGDLGLTNEGDFWRVVTGLAFLIDSGDEEEAEEVAKDVTKRRDVQIPMSFRGRANAETAPQTLLWVARKRLSDDWEAAWKDSLSPGT